MSCIYICVVLYVMAALSIRLLYCYSLVHVSRVSATHCVLCFVTLNHYVQTTNHTHHVTWSGFEFIRLLLSYSFILCCAILFVSVIFSVFIQNFLEQRGIFLHHISFDCFRWLSPNCTPFDSIVKSKQILCETWINEVTLNYGHCR